MNLLGLKSALFSVNMLSIPNQWQTQNYLSASDIIKKDPFSNPTSRLTREEFLNLLK